MNRYSSTSQSLERILTRVRRRSFPELARFRIDIGFSECDGLMRCDRDVGGFYIVVGDDFRGAPRRVLEGGIAHELAHILRDSALSPKQRDRMLAWYRASLPYRVRDERETDLCAVRRGYGPHLVALLSHARGLGYTFCREHGLRPGEIRIVQNEGLT